MRLYYTPGSCSLASHIIACEAGLEIDYDRVDLRNKTTASGRDFAKISPMGSVPALALPSGEVLTEASVIAQFLADQAPTTRLMPEAGSLERYRVQEWLGFVSTELHPGFSALWNPMTPEVGRRMAVDLLHRRFAHLDSHLEGRSYLMGDHFSYGRPFHRGRCLCLYNPQLVRLPQDQLGRLPLLESLHGACRGAAEGQGGS